jgi:hypothetical protein
VLVRDAIEQHVDFQHLEILRVAEDEERRVLSVFKPREGLCGMPHITQRLHRMADLWTENKSLSEIGDVIGVSRSVVAAQVSRARSRGDDRFKPRPITLKPRPGPPPVSVRRWPSPLWDSQKELNMGTTETRSHGPERDENSRAAPSSAARSAVSRQQRIGNRSGPS